MKKYISITKYIIIFLAGVFIISRPAHIVFANEISLAVSPPITHLQTNPGETTSTPLIIYNKSDQPVTVEILLKAFSPSKNEDGTPVYPQSSNSGSTLTESIFQYVTIMDGDKKINSLTLGSLQKQLLTIKIAVPNNQKESDYYFSIFFISESPENIPFSNQDNVTAVSSLRSSIASHVLLSVGSGELRAAIEEFSTDTLVTKGPISFNIRITNEGNHAFSPGGTLVIKNMLNRTVGTIPIGSSYILANSSRRIKLSWPYESPLGVYTATLTLNFPDNGSVFSQKIVFIGLPLKSILWISIAVILFAILQYRIQQKS